jgi:hypothetical protein
VQDHGESGEFVNSESVAAAGRIFITKRKKSSGDAFEAYKDILLVVFLNPGFFAGAFCLSY